MPLTLSDLSPFITRAAPTPADYSSSTDAQLKMNGQELQRRNIEGDQAAKLAQLAQQQQLEQVKEQGRGARSGQRMDFQREKFGFEQKKYGEGQSRLGDADLNSALDSFNKAVESGDQGGIDYWRQRLQMLQGTQVREDGGSQGPLATVNQDGQQPPEQAQALKPQTERQARLSSELNGPRIAAPKAVPAEPVDVQTPLTAEEEQLSADWQKSLEPGPPPAKWLEDEMLSRGEGQLEENSAGNQGAGFSKSLTPRIAPEPMKLEESNEGSAASAPRQPFVKGGNDQGAPEPYIPESPNAPLAPAAPPAAAPQPGTPASASPPPAGPPPAPAPGKFTVSRVGKDIMSLSRGIGPAPSIEADFAPLVQNARTPEEKRAATIALETAKAVSAKEGLEKGRLAGKQAYDFELNNGRKTRIGTGRGVGEGGYGGTGLDKATLGVRGDTDAAYRHIFDKTVTAGQLSRLNQGSQALSQLNSVAGAGTATGDIMAIKSAIKLTDDRISDSDFRVMAGSGGFWSEMSTKLKKFAIDADAGRVDARYMQDLRRTANAAAAALKNRRQELADEVANQMLSAPEFRRGDPEHEQEEREYYSAAARNEMLGRAPGRAGKPKAKPGGSTGVAKKFGL